MPSHVCGVCQTGEEEILVMGRRRATRPTQQPPSLPPLQPSTKTRQKQPPTQLLQGHVISTPPSLQNGNEPFVLAQLSNQVQKCRGCGERFTKPIAEPE